MLLDPPLICAHERRDFGGNQALISRVPGCGKSSDPRGRDGYSPGHDLRKSRPVSLGEPVSVAEGKLTVPNALL